MTTTSTVLSANSAVPAPASKPAKAAAVAPKQTAKVSTKAPAKAAVKTAKPSRPAAQKKAAPKVAKPVKAAVVESTKDLKPKKPKLVRDSFTIPKDEYAVIETLKQRSAALAQPVKKSELLRAGLKVLATMPDSALRAALQAVPSIKTGRPKAEVAAAAPIPANSAKPAAKASRK
ncbi:hypothetical protein LJR129_003096 [Acidovorax sp. LjRoot129]|uniref:hypothetical protein n=1 Tax=Acidovorax sp. LjRoot129 TaxID=3342260 RepID=UPI003ECF7CC0